MNSTDNNLFSFISSYIPRENRNPREDYLTQIFTWMLKNVDGLANSYMEFLCKKCGLVYESLEVTVESQKTVSNGRIDLIVMNSKVGFICEHKIGAGLSEDQIKKYMDCSKNDLGEGREYRSVLITQYYSQHTQDANIMLIWNDIYKFIDEFLQENYNGYENDAANKDKNFFMVKQFFCFLAPFKTFESMRFGIDSYTIDDKLTLEFKNGGNKMSAITNVHNAFHVLLQAQQNVKELMETCKNEIPKYGYTFLDKYPVSINPNGMGGCIHSDYWMEFQNKYIYAIEFMLFNDTQDFKPVFKVIKYNCTEKLNASEMYDVFDDSSCNSEQNDAYKIISPKTEKYKFSNVMYIEGDLMELDETNLIKCIMEKLNTLEKATFPETNSQQIAIRNSGRSSK